MAFNTAVIAGAEEYTSWDDVLARPASDGDRIMFMGLKWIYDGTNSIWVPDWAYGETLSEVTKVDGDEANDAALVAQGWTVTKSGGTTSFDGTRVRLYSAGATGHTCYLQRSTAGGAGNTYFAYGRIRVDSFIGSNFYAGCILSIKEGTRYRAFEFRYTTANQYSAFCNAGASTLGTVDDDVDASNEQFYLIRFQDSDRSMAWIDGSGKLSAPCTFHGAGGFSSSGAGDLIIQFGGFAGNASSDIYIRDFVIARY